MRTLSMLPVLGIASLTVAQSGTAGLPSLHPGETLQGEITDEAPAIASPTLDTWEESPQAVGERHALRVDAAGTYCVDLRSDAFDTYLILLDEGGAILAEDDDGGVVHDSRLVVDLEADVTYLLEACALHGRRGAYELELAAGAPPELPADEEAAREIEGLRRFVRGLEQDGEEVELAKQLNLLAKKLRAAGRNEEARPALERALELRRRELGPRHRSTAMNMNELALVLDELGDPRGARELLEEALPIYEEVYGPDHGETAIVLTNLGLVAYGLSDKPRAREVLRRALEIRSRIYGADDPKTLLAGYNLALALDDLVEARLHFERYLAHREKVLEGSDPALAAPLISLAQTLHRLGDDAEARELFERAYALRERAYGPRDPRTAKALSFLAHVLFALEDYGAALVLHERAQADIEAEYGPDHAETIRHLGSMVSTLQYTGQYDRASAASERILAYKERTFGPDHPELAATLGSLAYTEWLSGDHTAALRHYERAFAIEARAFGPGYRPNLMRAHRKALLLLDLGRPQEAWDLVHRAHEGLRAAHAAALASLSEGEAYWYLAKHLWYLGLELHTAASTEAPGPLRVAYADLLAWKGQLARALHSSRAVLAASATADQERLLEQLRSVQTRLSEAVLADRDVDLDTYGERLRALREERNDVELAIRRSLSEGAARDWGVSFEELSAALPPRSVLIDFFVQGVHHPARWEAGELVERGYWCSDHLTAWITHPGDEAPTVVDLDSTFLMEPVIAAWLDELVGRRGRPVGGDERESAGRALRRALWDPIAPYLEDVETVFVSPDGVVGALPFEVVPLADGRLAIEDHAFVYLQDVSALTHPEEGAPDYRSLLAVGAVDFQRGDELAAGPDRVESDGPEDSGRRGSFTDFWTPLRHTGFEADTVVAIHEAAFDEAGERLTLRGSGATERRLELELTRHSVLHLATHGFFNPEGVPSMWEIARNKAGDLELHVSSQAHHLIGKHPGLLSGLVCAGANRSSDDAEPDADDGYLTAEEVGWLDLSGVELVVLSACETGLGRAKSGEGLIGLRRAFQTAGARTVISSLWSVNDESTADLMRDFYKNLWLKGMGRHEALRAAQLAMLQRNRVEHGDALPTTWGAFVLSGEWR